MKCSKCGSEIREDATFCSECGTPVVAVAESKRICSACGAEILEGSKFCPICGTSTMRPSATGTSFSYSKTETYKTSSPAKQKAFSIVVIVLLVIDTLFALIAGCSGAPVSCALALIQFAGLVVTLLINKGKIKLSKPWLKKAIVIAIIVLGLFALIALPIPSSSDSGKKENTTSKSSSNKQEEVVVNNNASTPFGASEYAGRNYSDVKNELSDIGFTNFSFETIEDLKASESDMLGSVEAISINGISDFASNQVFDKSAKVLMTYHIYKKCTVKMHVNFVGNLIFSKYDVDVFEESSKQGTLGHGKDGDFTLTVEPGNHTFTFKKAGKSSPEGSFDYSVTGDMNISVIISCNRSEIAIQQEYVEDMGLLKDGEAMIMGDPSEYIFGDYKNVKATLESSAFTNITLNPVYDSESGADNIEKTISVSINGKTSLNRGDIFANDSEVVIKFHMDEADDPAVIAATELAKSLETTFPKKMAKRAVTVATTNGYATDVFSSDGNTLDPKKFHSYSDIGDYFMTVEREGTWSAVDESTWRVDDIVLRIYGDSTYVRASCNVKMDADCYLVSDLNCKISVKDYIDSSDSSKTSLDHYEPSEFNSFLTVPFTLVEEDRDETAAKDKITAVDRHNTWVANQFSVWDGRHMVLTDLIKESLNDPKSFDHVETTYIDVSIQELKDYVNQVLKDCGYSNRVEVGDLFVMETFRAKNAFNATVKNTAYGIAYEETDTIVLIGVE